jgi:hypothetical protein
MDENFQVTDAERQLIESLRQLRPGDDNLRLVIELADGGWEIDMSEPGTKRGARGVGITFDQAWDGMDPYWA